MTTKIAHAQRKFSPAGAASAAEPKPLVLLPRADRFSTCGLESRHSAPAGWLKEHIR